MRTTLVPSLLVAAEEKVGAVVSITNALLLARESLPSKAGRVRVALLPAASLMVPPFRAREEVAS